MSTFKQRVIKIVKLIPKGSVASYGQVALYLGLPRSARQVGWVLNQNKDEDVPWWRIVNNEGRISIKGSIYDANDQKEKLQLEGIVVANDLTFDINKYRFVPDEEFVRELKLDNLYLEMVGKRIYFSDQHKLKR